jgi:hypothetical protein
MESKPPRSPSGRFLPTGRPSTEEPDRMVAVEDLNPPEEAKIKSEPKGVPASAQPTEALAEEAGARGTSADVLPEEGYGDAEGIAYAFNRAGSLFRRFSAGLHMLMAVRYYESLPRNSEVIEETSASACRGSRTPMTALRTCTVRWRSEVTSTSFQVQRRRNGTARPSGQRVAHLSHRPRMTYA